MSEGLVKHEAISPWVNGAQYRATHKASVIGILGADAPPVHSRGSRFYSIDRWTARSLIQEMCSWAENHPGCMPTEVEVKEWVKAVNLKPVPDREIVIANTPNELSYRTAMALTGGAYHEAFHPKYSCRRNLDVKEIKDIVLPRWAKVADWSKYTKALFNWSNICDDIWIERHGTTEFTGTYTKLCDLADFVLTREEDSWEEERKQGVAPSAMRLIQASFRDLGKGYPTDKVKERLTSYRNDNSEAFDLVVGGPLRPLLDAIIEAPAEDDLASLRIAMDIITTLGELSKQDQEQDQAEDGEAGDGEEKCPHCGAAAEFLKVRPKTNSMGGKEKGVGIVTCTKCGWQDEVKVQPKKKSKKSDPKNKDGKDSKSKGKKGPDIKGFGDESLDPQDEKSQPAKGKGSDKAKKGEKGEQGDSGSREEAGEGDEGEGEGEGEEGEEGEGEGEGSGSEGEEEGEGGEEGLDKNSQGIKGGGHKDSGAQFDGYDWEQLAKEAMKRIEKDPGILDGNTALEQAVNEELDQEDRVFGTEEAAWRPYDPELDEAAIVAVSRKGLENDKIIADRYIEETRTMCAYLRSRLRSVVHSLEIVHISHGKRRGRGLSSRFLVDTKCALLAKEQPQRAYFDRGIAIDTKMAAAVVNDESSSTYNIKELLAKIMIAITEPLDALHVPTLALGIRDGRSSPNGYCHWGHGHGPAGEKSNEYHRFDGVRYDIFKDWHERFSAVKSRFANVQAVGGTPLSDGIQYALMRLSQRDETHRFMFVVTDGQPNPMHEKVICRQIRVAKEAGIHIIGVGVGSSATYVKELFPDHIWAAQIETIPNLLVAKLNQLVDVFGAKRGFRVKEL